MTIQRVANPTDGILAAKEILYKILTPQSLLFLSGGNTPKPLYKKIAEENILKCGAIALVDERYGEPFHENSNAKLVKDCGITNFEQVLIDGKTLAQTAERYNKKVNELFQKFSHRVAIMGIGSDGHTAGIPVRVQPFGSVQGKKVQGEHLVTELSDFPPPFTQRITLTYKALSMMDFLLLIVFGEDKKEALRNKFPPFYTREEISQKTLLITDQKV